MRRLFPDGVKRASRDRETRDRRAGRDTGMLAAMRPRPHGAVFVSLLLCAVEARAQDIAAPPRFARAAAILERAVETEQIPGAAIAVLQGDGEGGSALVWAQGFGWADVQAQRAATADTSFPLASISKPFTATLVAQLWERGALDLDAPANRYLDPPGVRALRGGADEITLRRLLNHTAGLPTHWNFFYDGVAAPPARAESIAAFGFAAWPPGQRSNYSNFAFGILDHIVARQHGKPFRTVLREQLLAPLGMDHTDLGPPAAAPQHAVRSYRVVRGRFEPIPPYGFDHDGASAVWSSARDLMAFARLQIGAGTVDGTELLTPETARAMRERRASPADNHYGMAWGVGQFRGHRKLSHTGGMPGVATALEVYPDHGSAIAILLNARDRGFIQSTVGAVRQQLFEADGPGLPPAQRAEPPAVYPPLGPYPDGERPAAPTGTWRGLVRCPDGYVPVAIDLTDPPTVRLDGELCTDVRVEARTPDRLRIVARGPLPVTPGAETLSAGAGDSTPAIRWELDPTPTGWAGVAYAEAPGVCRLPFAVRIEPDAAPAITATGPLRVVTYNILVGFGDYAVGDPYLPGDQRAFAAATWLAAQQPDVVALQECNGFTEARLLELAAAWGHEHVVLLKEDGYPPALTSRWPIEHVERRREGLHHGLLWCRTGGVDFTVVHVIPHPGMERKLAEVEQILATYRAARDAKRPSVLLGDFNAIAAGDVERYSPAALERYAKWKYLTVDGRPAETAIQPILDAGAVDALALAGLPEVLPLPRIDFVFASPDLPVRRAQWHADPRLLRWSDHPPVVVDFTWSPGQK